MSDDYDPTALTPGVGSYDLAAAASAAATAAQAAMEAANRPLKRKKQDQPVATHSAAHTTAAATPHSSGMHAAPVAPAHHASSAAYAAPSARAPAAPVSPDSFLHAIPSGLQSALQNEVLSLIFPGKNNHPPHLYKNLPGPQPISMTRAHLTQSLAPHNYYACEKSDGERAMIFINRERQAAFIIDRKFAIRQVKHPAYAEMWATQGDSLFDGELVLFDPAHGVAPPAGQPLATFMAFDVLILNGVRMMERKLSERLMAIGNGIVGPYRKRFPPVTVSSAPAPPPPAEPTPLTFAQMMAQEEETGKRLPSPTPIAASAASSTVTLPFSSGVATHPTGVLWELFTKPGEMDVIKILEDELNEHSKPGAFVWDDTGFTTHALEGLSRHVGQREIDGVSLFAIAIVLYRSRLLHWGNRGEIVRPASFPTRVPIAITSQLKAQINTLAASIRAKKGIAVTAASASSSSSATPAPQPHPLAFQGKAFWPKRHLEERIMSHIRPLGGHEYEYNDGKRRNKNDGVIFTPEDDDYWCRNVPLLKWKHLGLNTIDFLTRNPWFDHDGKLMLYSTANAMPERAGQRPESVTVHMRSTLLTPEKRAWFLSSVHGKDSAIAEMQYDSKTSSWQPKNFRWDKSTPNFMTTVISTLETIVDNVQPSDLYAACGCAQRAGAGGSSSSKKPSGSNGAAPLQHAHQQPPSPHSLRVAPPPAAAASSSSSIPVAPYSPPSSSFPFAGAPPALYTAGGASTSMAMTAFESIAAAKPTTKAGFGAAAAAAEPFVSPFE